MGTNEFARQEQGIPGICRGYGAGNGSGKGVCSMHAIFGYGDGASQGAGLDDGSDWGHGAGSGKGDEFEGFGDGVSDGFGFSDGTGGNS